MTSPGWESKTSTGELGCVPTPVLPAAFASQLHTLYELRKLRNLDGGFSAGATGGISNSRPTSVDRGHSPQRVLRLKRRELLFGEAGGIMAHNEGVGSKTNGPSVDARRSPNMRFSISMVKCLCDQFRGYRGCGRGSEF